MFVKMSLRLIFLAINFVKNWVAIVRNLVRMELTGQWI